MRTVIRVLKAALLALVLPIASSPATAAEFMFVGSGKAVWLQMRGPIEPGDLDRLLLALGESDGGRAGREFFHKRQALWIDSPGGSVAEAIRLAEFIKSAMIPVWVSGRCESACFLILAASVERNLGGRIGIHRPFFTDEASRGLSIEESQRQYTQMSKRFYQLLDEFEVPRQLVDRMRSMASTEVYYLSQADMDLMGIRQPWFEQLLISRCGLDKHREAAMQEEIMRHLADENRDRNWRTPPDYREYQVRVDKCTNALTYEAGSRAYFAAAEDLVKRLRKGGGPQVQR